jgi:hypothetical protein
MGTLRSLTDWSGATINNVILGDPFTPEDGWYGWDGSQVPNGVIDSDGNIFSEVEDDES